MKKSLACLFFVSDRARGAVFAATMFTIGNFLWFSIYCAASVWRGKISETLMDISWFGAALITLYALVLGIGALIRLIRVLLERHEWRPLLRLIPAGACFAAGGIGFVRFFPPVAHMIYWLGPVCLHEDYRSEPLRTCWGAGLPGVPPGCYAALFLLSLLLLLAGGLLLAAVFAAAEKRRFRSLFGKETLALWGALAVWYFVFLGMALYESGQAAEARQAVERRFGRPLTAAGVAELYREGGAADAEFWKRHQELYLTMPQIPNGEKAVKIDDFALPDRPTTETLAWYGRVCRENRAAIDAWEKCFDRMPPLPPHQEFLPGRLMDVLFSEFASCRAFNRLERSRLIHALALGDIDTAWACWRRIGHTAAVLGRSPFLIGHLVWYSVEREWLNGAEKLLESRLLTDARLDEMEADLAALEREVPRNYEQTLYTEAAYGLDAIAALEDGTLSVCYWGWEENDGNAPRPGAFAPYRWIFPQFWYYVALDEKTALQNYLRPDSEPAVDMPMCNLFGLKHYLTRVRERYSLALTARTRGMRALIRAEKYRRLHGEFPKTLDDLPEDPLTGGKMIYEIGPAEVGEIVWDKVATAIDGHEKTTVEAVQVHSDPAKVKEKIPFRLDDQTRALIRLGTGGASASEVQTE